MGLSLPLSRRKEEAREEKDASEENTDEVKDAIKPPESAPVEGNLTAADTLTPV